MTKRDGYDLWDAFNKHRQATAAQETAEHLGKMARIQEANAATARIAAKAEAEARSREARAAEIKAGIEQKRYNQEVSLKNAKYDLLRLFNFLKLCGSSFESLGGDKLYRLICDCNYFFKNNVSLKEAIKFENNLSEIDKLNEMWEFMENRYSLILDEPVVKDCKLIVDVLSDCASIESGLSDIENKINNLNIDMLSAKVDVSNKIKNYNMANFPPSKKEYFEGYIKNFELNLSKLFEMKCRSQIFSYPLVVGAIFTMTTLGFLYALPVLVVALISYFYKVKCKHEINEIKYLFDREKNYFDGLIKLNFNLNESLSDFELKSNVFLDIKRSLFMIVSDALLRGNIPEKSVWEIISAANGQRFLEGKNEKI